MLILKPPFVKARPPGGHLPEAWGTGPVLEEALRTRRSDGATVDDLEQARKAPTKIQNKGVWEFRA